LTASWYWTCEAPAFHDEAAKEQQRIVCGAHVNIFSYAWSREAKPVKLEHPKHRSV
jgi:hypothetical protein